MKRNLAFCSLVGLFLCAGAASAADDGPADAVPELKALDHYVGSWDVEITSKDLPSAKGRSVGKWVLDGRFLEQTGALHAKDGSTIAKLTTLMTFDANKRVYRSWTFLSDGTVSESEAGWDAKAKIMTSVRRKDESGNTATTTADFSEAGVEKWKIVFMDQGGKTIGEMSGKNTRQKK